MSNNSIDRPLSPFVDTLLFNRAALGYFLKGQFRLPKGHRPSGGISVPEDFSAICVASMDDPDSDALMIQYLRRLGITHVRLDYDYSAPDSHPARFLEQLLTNSFNVLLRLVQPPQEAKQMGRPEAQERWRQFVVTALDRFGGRLEAVEIGNTVNRRSWSGYKNLEHFMAAWTIAHAELRRRNIPVAGPNVSDFEPPYNAGFLSVMARHGTLPDIHTDNLFVERAIEPENYDRKIIGLRLAWLHKLNLVKKARLLGRISQMYGIGKTWSTTAFWTLKRIGRRLVESEQKQADYLVRYMVLAAASGGLERAYWGPLVSQREGLVDDGTGSAAPHELVTFYGTNYGCLKDYRVRPALDAFACFTRLIPGSRYIGKLTATRFLQVHEFETAQHRIHVLWTTNTRAADVRDLYSEETLGSAEWISRDGKPIAEMLSLVSESPIYLRWPLEQKIAVDKGAAVFRDALIDGNRRGGQYYHFNDGRWQGLVFAADRAEADCLIESLHPDKIASPSKPDLLRKSRNIIWTVDDPRHPGQLLVAKKPHKLKLNKKINDHFKPSKAVRSWNGACQLLRYGIHSPLPVAYFERADGVDTLNNWYICEYAGDVPSVRDFFEAYAKGEASYLGVDKKDFYNQLCTFLLRLHEVGTYFRDLTGGNILVHLQDSGEIKFSLIDTARARFYITNTPMAQRLSDLKRTCYKLDWDNRTEFMSLYLGALKKRFTWWYRLPFHSFDLKMKAKRLMKGKGLKRV